MPALVGRAQRQRGLARSRQPGHDDHLGDSGDRRGAPQQRQQQPQLLVPPDEVTGDSGKLVGAHPPPRGRLLLAAEDLPVQLPQLRPRVDAVLLRQHPDPGPVHGERLRLSAAAVQGHHQLATQPLPQGSVADQRGQLRHEFPVQTEREQCLGAQLCRVLAQLTKPIALVLDEPRPDVDERVVAPARQRPVEQLHGAAGIGGGRGGRYLGGELRRVDDRHGVQLVAGRAGEDQLRLRAAADRGDDRLDPVARPRGRIVRPEPVDQAVDGDDASVVGRQARDECPLQRGERHGHPVDAHLDPTEDADPIPTHGAKLARSAPFVTARPERSRRGKRWSRRSGPKIVTRATVCPVAGWPVRHGHRDAGGLPEPW